MNMHRKSDKIKKLFSSFYTKNKSLLLQIFAKVRILRSAGSEGVPPFDIKINFEVL